MSSLRRILRNIQLSPRLRYRTFGIIGGMEKESQIKCGVTDFARMRAENGSFVHAFRGGDVALCEEISECKAGNVKSEELV